MTTFVKELFLVIMIRWTKRKNNGVRRVVRLCETQCLYHVIFRKNIFIEPIHAFIVKFLFPVSPVVLLAAVTLCPLLVFR